MHCSSHCQALTKLSDIIGNDAKIVKKQWNHRKEKEYWEGVYSFDWKEVTMTYDFCRSVSPNKPNVNSESHYLSSSQYRNLYMTPDFVRSAYWLATLHGMNVNYTWFWAREKDGAIRKDLMNYKGYDTVTRKGNVTPSLHLACLEKPTCKNHKS